MTGNDFFDPKRFLQICKNGILNSRTPLLIQAAIIIGASLLLFSWDSSVRVQYEFYFLILLILGGLPITSTTFQDIKDSHGMTSWLLLPGSTFEKYLSRLLLSSIVLAVSMLFLYILSSLVFNCLFYILSEETSITIFNPFTMKIWQGIGVYLVFQSLFFLGAVFFRNHPFMKTGFILILVFLLFTTLSIIGLDAWLSSNIDFSTGTPYEHSSKIFSILLEEGDLHDSISSFVTILVNVLQTIFFGTAPFCWWISYRKLKKLEV